MTSPDPREREEPRPMDPLDESLARRALRKAAMTDRPVADLEPLSDSALGHWRRELQHRTVDPSLPWPDHEVMVLVARFLATLDAARSHPDEAGLREAAWQRVNADILAVIGDRATRNAVSDLLNHHRAALSEPAVPVAGAEEGLTGRAVHAAWRDGMLAQGRDVAPERMSWDTLSIEDRLLDDGIAAALCPDEFGVNRLAKALVDSGLMQRYSDYANSLPTMRHGTPEELARDWAPTILAALRVARARPDEAGLREALDWLRRVIDKHSDECTVLRTASEGGAETDLDSAFGDVTLAFEEGPLLRLAAQPAVPVAGAEEGERLATLVVQAFTEYATEGERAQAAGWRFLTDAYDIAQHRAPALRAAQPEDDGLDRSGVDDAPLAEEDWTAEAAIRHELALPVEERIGVHDPWQMATRLVEAIDEARSGVDDVGELREAAADVVRRWVDYNDARWGTDAKNVAGGALQSAVARLRAALATTQPERRDP